MSYDAYQSYQAVHLHAQTAQASPLQLVLVLMDGLLDELARARAHIEARRFELKAASLDKCVSIINGLSSALDLEAGGEVVHNLARLYDYCADRLYRAGVEMNPAVVDEVQRLLGQIRGGWQGVMARHA
ncbi:MULTISPECIES: flagellar export chaperone FliS [Roseateles]|jgi:flagellar protein FliS|uniref:Flagellar secretion chaperone FliS n=2 Tax=Roseateles TaxID=93681 RepID=A0A0U3L9I2_9BURK|nr:MULTISPECIES: flagellar export chaperone FliS [Roseateles]ALV07982.1 flagellar biosynthesis protein FliS [Roseateles depolymerans]MBB3194127.1 flagellar protein FliS [Roseateles terrae]OWQ87988.1 flagellar export chaperone FliS [Roseateles terrae]REG21799.1 flagellar protein FliS [Roseateles depolymerans]